MDFLLPALTSFLITIFTIPFTIMFAKKYGLLDNPRIRPHPAHIQKRTVPRAGGLACFIAIGISIILFLSINKEILGIFSALSVLLLIGLADDKYKSLSPYLRLLGQLVAAFIAISVGIGISFITNPLGGIIYLNPFVANTLAVIWIVWVMNMINWSKGVDGQMPSITAVASLILGLLSLKLTLAGDASQANIAKLSFLISGTSFGLLVFNWYPAKIFPGFSGSTILGFMIAILSILSGAKLATATLVLLIPATDFAYTFIRRILQGKSPVWGDRGHLHHKLLQMGYSHKTISLFYFLGSVILGAIALSLSSQGKLFATLIVAIIILGGILWLNFFGAYLNHQDPDNG